MLFDNFDKKIKEAAEQHHPAYDESAWKKMESLLNLHLPQQKKDRRRIFLLLFTFLAVGGGAFFMVSKPHADKPAQAINKNETTIDKAVTANKGTAIIQPEIEKTNSRNAERELEPEINNNSSNPINQHLLANRNSIQKKPGLIKPANVDINKLSANTVTEENKNAVAAEMKKKNIQSNESGQPNVDIATNENKVDETIAVNEQKQKDEHPDEMSAKKTSSRKDKQNGNGLSFFVSAGPDISKAGSSKAGKITLTYGIGAAYTINRFTIKTGIFEAKKIYWANPDEYKLSWTPPNVKFEGADANCRVVEIPLKVSYNFGFTNKSNWFAGAGLSSYLMKDEKYVLEYKTSTGAPYYHPYEAKNENKHYFSILDISAGYSLQLNKTFTISAEPYLEIPMSGIGAGKIHLNSGGILFTLGVSPFRK